MDTDRIEKLDERILDLISHGIKPSDDDLFQDLALDLFQYQYSHNAIYKYICDKIGQTPSHVKSWEQISSLHTSSFKEAAITCTPITDNTIFFETSGTTTSSKGRHYLDHLRLYEAALKCSFKHYVLPDVERMQMFILFPSITEIPHSSLAHMFCVLKNTYGTENSKFYSVSEQIQHERLVKDIQQSIFNDEPILLLGTTLGLYNFYKNLIDKNEFFKLSLQSRLMDTGGSKGQRQEITRGNFLQLSRECLGLDRHSIINEYGMTEMSSQFYDSSLYDLTHGLTRCFQKIPPPWVRSRVMASDGIHEVSVGEIGLLRHLDLANRNSVCSLQTEDIALRTPDGFELLGRPSASELRGCSLIMEEQ